jgi:hypothetical protein
MYTDTNKTRRFLPRISCKTHTANAWFNGLTAQQKLLIILWCAKDAAARIQVLLYLEWPALEWSLLHQWPLNQVDSGQQKVQAWSSEDTPTEELLQIKTWSIAVWAKNKIDIQYPQSKKNLRIKSVHCYGKRAKKGKLNNSDNPIGRDTIGRAMQQKIMLASMNSSKKEELSRPHQ